MRGSLTDLVCVLSGVGLSLIFGFWVVPSLNSSGGVPTLGVAGILVGLGLFLLHLVGRNIRAPVTHVALGHADSRHSAGFGVGVTGVVLGGGGGFGSGHC